MKTLDLFAGAGGWDVAAGRLGLDVDRVEIWAPANATAAAAGMRTVHEDVTTFSCTPGQYQVHLASPSCKRYSMAGNGAGRKALDQVLCGVRIIAEHPHEHAEAVRLIGDADAALTLEPLRIALEGLPEFIAWEQTPAVLPVWSACAEVLQQWGYSTAVGILNAEQYGVPQTRRRAILVARRGGPVSLPAPTHSRFWSRDPGRMDDGVKPWVSMAEALEWPDGVQMQARKRMGSGMEERFGSRPGRETHQPAFTVRASAGGMEPGGFRLVQYQAGAAPNSTVREVTSPAPAIAFGNNAARHQFVLPSENTPTERVRDSEAMYLSSRKITAQEAAILQTFPRDHPWQGYKGEIFQQIGNAVPPLLAQAVLEALIR